MREVVHDRVYCIKGGKYYQAEHDFADKPNRLISKSEKVCQKIKLKIKGGEEMYHLRRTGTTKNET